MSEPTIPPNNLPIYLQKYSVSILCKDPASDCPDVPPQGGCAGTRYGCCSDKQTAKSDPQGSNCPKECGTVRYTVVGLLPSNQPGKRVWNLTLTGTLLPHEGDYTILYDFSEVDYQDKIISFEDILSGTITLCGHILDASRIASYEYCDTTSILKIKLMQRHWGFHLKRESGFSMNILVNDATGGCNSQSCGNGSTTLALGSTTYFTLNSKGGIVVTISSDTSSPSLTYWVVPNSSTCSTDTSAYYGTDTLSLTTSSTCYTITPTQGKPFGMTAFYTQGTGSSPTTVSICFSSSC